MLKRTERESLDEIQLAREPDLRIGEATLRPSSRVLDIGGERRVLEPRVTQLLVALARRDGSVLGRDDLIDLCWGGRIVGEDAISRCVAKARKAADAAGFTIETVPRVGYRLVTPIQGRSPKKRLRIWMAAATGVALVVAILAVFGWTRPPTTASSEYPPIAIGQFTTSSDDAAVRARTSEIEPQVVDALAKAGILTVRRLIGPARARFFVHGQVTANGDAVHALIQMDDARTRITLLSQELALDRDEMPLIADKVAAAVADAVTRSGAYYALTSATDPVETAAFMDVVLQVAAVNYLEAEHGAERLYSRRPQSRIAPFALSLATIYALPALPSDERANALGRARNAAQIARERLPEFGDVYVAPCKLYPIGFADCEKNLREGIARDSTAPDVGSQLALLLMHTGRLREAQPLASKALSQHPYDPTKVIHSLYIDVLLGDESEETNMWAYARRFWPKSRTARQRYVSLMAAGRWREAEAMLPLVLRMESGSEETLTRVFAALRGDRGMMGDAIQHACRGDVADTAAVTCFTALAISGEPRAAVEAAMKFYPVRPSEMSADREASFVSNGGDPGPVFLLWGKALAPMRQEPGFSVLASRLGLLGYWRKNGPPDFCRTERAPVCKLI